DITMTEAYRRSPAGNQPGLVGYQMVVKLNSDAPGGVLKHELILKTNDPTSEILTVAVDGNIQAALRVAPNSVSLSGLKVGETKTFKVQGIGNRPFRITDVKADGKDISAELPQQALTVHNLTLRCQPVAPGEIRRTLTIVTDLDKGASVTVAVHGNAAQ